MPVESLPSGLQPGIFPYALEERVIPNWKDVDPINDNNWRLTIGSVMKDLLCAMIKIGNYENVILLYELSNILLSDLVYRAPQTQPIEDIKLSIKKQISNKSIGKSPVKKLGLKSVIKSIGKVFRGMRPSIIFHTIHSPPANNEGNSARSKDREGRRYSWSIEGSKHSSLASIEGENNEGITGANVFMYIYIYMHVVYVQFEYIHVCIYIYTYIR
jgi:hypothetical protein